MGVSWECYVLMITQRKLAFNARSVLDLHSSMTSPVERKQDSRMPIDDCPATATASYALPSIQQPLSILLELHLREERIGNRLTKPHGAFVSDHGVAIDASPVKCREAYANHWNACIDCDIAAL
jgi:hypothetical protein